MHRKDVWVHKRRHICSSPFTQKQEWDLQEPFPGWKKPLVVSALNVCCLISSSWNTKHQSYSPYTAVISANKQKPTNPSIQRQARSYKAQIWPLNVRYLNQGRCSISALVVLSYPCPLITRPLPGLSAPRKAMLEPQEIHPSPRGEKSSLRKPWVLSLATSQVPGSTGNLH